MWRMSQVASKQSQLRSQHVVGIIEPAPLFATPYAVHVAEYRLRTEVIAQIVGSLSDSTPATHRRGSTI
jgi:hypothetical protein